MIKVIAGFKVRKGQDISTILPKLWLHAAQYPGFKGAEHFLSQEDASLVVTLSTWETAEDWKAWQESMIAQELLRQAESLLAEKPRVTMYSVVMPRLWS
jgi:heme-degrading monooxygenase HmoA